MISTIPNLLDSDSLPKIETWLEQAQWQTGQSTAGKQAARQKSNTEMDQSCSQWSHINQLVVNTLYQHPVFQQSALPHKVSAAFVARYTTGHAYGKHIDDPIMGQADGRYRSDLACTVFLTSPESYEGGELVVHDSAGAQSIKLDRGSAVVYPASSLHEILPVTGGERTVCVLWVQSLVRDPHRREILAELGDARSALNRQLPDARVTQSIDLTYANLIRLWADV
jgi:PKHD-type hydroxylase